MVTRSPFDSDLSPFSSDPYRGNPLVSLGQGPQETRRWIRAPDRPDDRPSDGVPSLGSVYPPPGTHDVRIGNEGLVKDSLSTPSTALCSALRRGLTRPEGLGTESDNGDYSASWLNGLRRRGTLLRVEGRRARNRIPLSTSFQWRGTVQDLVPLRPWDVRGSRTGGGET